MNNAWNAHEMFYISKLTNLSGIDAFHFQTRIKSKRHLLKFYISLFFINIIHLFIICKGHY